MAHTTNKQQMGFEIDAATEEDMKQKRTVQNPPPSDKIEKQVEAEIKQDD